MRTLRDNPYCSLLVDDARRVVVFRRKPTPFPSVEEGARVMDDVRAAGAELQDASSWGLLVDSRDGPLRNDEGFETMMRERRGAMLGRFRKVATLVKTAVGVLQANRIKRENADANTTVFTDENAALAYLREP